MDWFFDLLPVWLAVIVISVFVWIFYSAYQEDELHIAWKKAGTSYTISQYAGDSNCQFLSSEPQNLGCRNTDSYALVCRTQFGPLALCASGTIEKPQFRSFVQQH